MNSDYLMVAIIGLIFVLIYQLVRMNIYVIRIKKNKELNQQEIKEDKSWEFIKGLY